MLQYAHAAKTTLLVGGYLKTSCFTTQSHDISGVYANAQRSAYGMQNKFQSPVICSIHNMDRPALHRATWCSPALTPFRALRRVNVSSAIFIVVVVIGPTPGLANQKPSRIKQKRRSEHEWGRLFKNLTHLNFESRHQSNWMLIDEPDSVLASQVTQPGFICIRAF